MVTDREYKPHPVRPWAEIIAQKDAEIAELKAQIERLRSLIYDVERQAHVDMGR